MTSSVSRRDFLKLAGLLPLGAAAPRWTTGLSGLGLTSGQQKNVIVVVFDAFSAFDISLYGYSRATTPNLARLAKRAVVYHNHFAGSNFTTSGTASLLTGTLPWTHRAIEDDSRVADSVVSHNIFNVFPDYYRTAFTHNSWALTLLSQFGSYIEEIVPREKLYLKSYDGLIHSLFTRDDDIATVSWTLDMKIQGGSSYSLFLSHLYKILQDREIANLNAQFPLGVPINGSKDGFVLEQAIDWLKDRLATVPHPFFGYFHFLPPHAPYRTSLEFYHHFKNDGLKLVNKPIDVFGGPLTNNDLLQARTEYDEFILYADKAFGELFDFLEKSRLLDNTWVILTSDHGEMFERGLIGHGNPTLYQPVIRTPLFIFEPGREVGTDIYTASSAVDVLPTLAHVTGHTVPDWTEGVVLPPYADTDSDRNLYAVYARKNGQYAPLTQASTTLVRDPYKLLYSFGYANLDDGELIRLYDIKQDPEELLTCTPHKKTWVQNCWPS
jgi:arylsulfatase A-like enzyme